MADCDQGRFDSVALPLLGLPASQYAATPEKGARIHETHRLPLSGLSMSGRMSGLTTGVPLLIPEGDARYERASRRVR